LRGERLGDPQRALFHYFVDLATVRVENKPEHDCPALVVQYTKNDKFDPIIPSGWKPVWEGHRRGDDTERFVLFNRMSP
jgi:hypothetical protein